MSKCTVVSLCPYDINAFKPGLNPEEYHIPEAKIGDISLLVVSDSFYFRQVPLQTEQIRIPVSSNELAESLVKDHLQALLYVSATARPGLFWVEGEKTVAEIKKEHADKLKAAAESQLRWCEILVGKADDDWQKHRSLHLITRVQRKAATILNVKREWLNKAVTDTKECNSCFSRIDSRATVCPICRRDQTTKKEV